VVVLDEFAGQPGCGKAGLLEGFHEETALVFVHRVSPSTKAT
jgi:hypothetical protein